PRERWGSRGARLGGRAGGAPSGARRECAGGREAGAMAAAGPAAVLLPVAFSCLAAERRPPLAALRAAGVAVAIASDCNPGSAPGTSLLLAMSMATRLFGLTTEEALLAVTRHAARALGLAGSRRALVPGGVADVVVWNVRAPEELGYWIGFNPRRTVVRAAEVVRWPNQNP